MDELNVDVFDDGLAIRRGQGEPTLLRFSDLAALPPVAAALDVLRAFVKGGAWAGVYHLRQANSEVVLSCRHCNGFSPDNEIWMFQHDETCIIVKALAALAQFAEPERGEGE